MPLLRAWPTLALILAGALLAAACSPPAAEPPSFPPPEVTAVSVKPEPLAVAFEYVGQAEGSREVEVRARVTGIVLAREYVEGASVKAGVPLFLIDPAPFEVALAQAEAEVASARARLAQASREVARLKPLFAKRVVSQKEVDDAISAEDIARADVQLSQARVREAKLNLSYTRVAAPIAGVTGRALKSEGSLVTANGDSLLTRLSQVDPIYVNFSLPESEQLKLKREAAAGRLKMPAEHSFNVEVVLADGTLYPHKGQLNFADARVDTATGTIDARAVLPNPERALLPGQFVRVRVNGAVRPAAILVPQRAVLEGPQGKFVMVVRDGKAESQPIQVGDWSGARWVVSEGLKAGDQVIVDGVVKVQPGSPVKVADPSDKLAGPATNPAVQPD